MKAAVVAALGLATVMAAAPRAQALSLHHLASPNGRIEVIVGVSDIISYDVRFDGKALIAGARLSLDVDHQRFGKNPDLIGTWSSSVDRQIQPPVRQKAALLPERYNELRLDFHGYHYAVVFRAYDQGVAYRFEIAAPVPQVKIYSEEATFRFAADAEVVFGDEESGFFSHNEPQWKRARLGELTAAKLATIPAVVATPAGPKVAIAESDVEDYPGLWLRGTGGPELTATFPPYPLEEKATRDRDVKVVRAADYIAVTRGKRTLPWRILVVAERDVDLVASTLTYLLARPSQIEDTSWIRPGKVAWDWWNALNLRDVPFKPGVNTDTYKAYIDFASKYGIEYVILDEGWYKVANVLQVVPTIDMPALLAYAKQKNVGIILWVIWKTFDKQMEPALAQYQKWGVKGLKIDFMQRDDQPVMNFYTRVCREAAKRKMLVDFHGGVRATLLARTWPNLVSTEGVRGLEWVKWSDTTEPEHDVTLPFTRMLLGPMDFTPGAMLNADRKSFKIVFNQPMSMGTRCHQLAMYVVYESPLQMLADSPSNYMAEPESMEFLGPVPSVWDETRVLDGRLGDYVLVARRKGKEWWVGAMTDWTPRELDVDLSFLGDGRFKMTSYEDGPAAATKASDYRKTARAVDRSARLKIKLAPGGGWAARIGP